MLEKEKEVSDDGEKEKENSEEDSSEENEEELEEIVQEKDYGENTALNRFLSNPWKQVSLDERNIIPVSNLEENLPEREIPKENKEQENIEYTLFKSVEDGKYQTLAAQGEIINKNLSEEEKTFDKLRRIHDDPRRLSSEFKSQSNDKIKYVRPEETKRTDYLIKKKFGNN